MSDNPAPMTTQQLPKNLDDKLCLLLSRADFLDLQEAMKLMREDAYDAGFAEGLEEAADLAKHKARRFREAYRA